MGISSTGESAEVYTFFQDLFSAGSLFPDPNGTSTPNGYLNFLLFDENYNMEDLGYKPVNSCSGTGCVYEELSLQVEVEKAGYIYIYVSNESEKVSEVFFDDFEITHHQSPVVFGHDYYPFGLPMAGRQITDEEYRFDYQGQFAEKDSITGFNSFALRQYDARFGRWMSTDPYGQYASPYVGMGNMGHVGVDPDGGLFGLGTGASIAAGAGIGFAIGSGVGLLVDKENWWKYGAGFAIIGGTIGGFTGNDFTHGSKVKSMDPATGKVGNNFSRSRVRRLKYPSYKGELKKTFSLFNRSQFGIIGLDFLSVSLRHSFNMESLFRNFNFNFDIRAPFFEINLINPKGESVYNYTNSIRIGGSQSQNNDPETQRFHINGTYTINTDVDLMPGQGFEEGTYIDKEYGKVQLNVNTRRLSHVQYSILKARGWHGNVHRVRWWQFWQ